MSYDDYKPTSVLRWTKDGKEVTRTLYVRAADEVEAMAATGCPARGDPLDVSTGSAAVEYLYCDDVSISQVEGAAGDGSGLFLFEISSSYRPLSINNPTVNKARWKISFRPQQNNLRNVQDEAHQTHYTGNGSGDPEYPEVLTGINVTEDGPQGVDVDEMVEVLSIEFWKHPSAVESFLEDVRGIANKTNVADLEGPWGSYAAGEARITGLEVSVTSGEMASVTVEISRSKNDASIDVFLDTVGDTGGTVSVTKTGWEYLWIRFLKGNKEDSDDVRPLAIDAHVAKFYESGDYSVLGISSGIWI